MSKWCDRKIGLYEQWSVSAWVCRTVGCELKTTMYYDRAEQRWINQHGENPEHVLLIPSTVGGFISLDDPGESDLAPPPICKVSIDDWLRRVHSALPARPAPPAGDGQ